MLTKKVVLSLVLLFLFRRFRANDDLEKNVSVEAFSVLLTVKVYPSEQARGWHKHLHVSYCRPLSEGEKTVARASEPGIVVRRLNECV